MRTIALAALLVALGCSHPSARETATSTPDVYPTSESSCWLWCGWSTELSACKQDPAVRKYGIRALSSVHQHLSSHGGVPSDQCVCVTFRFTRNGLPSEISVQRATDADASQVVQNALIEAAPYGDVPENARCVLEETIHGSFGGYRR